MDTATVEPRAQLRTYLTDGLLDGGDPAASAPPAPRTGTPGLWRVPAPKGDAPGGAKLPRDKGSRSQSSASCRERRPPLEKEARTLLRDGGGPSVSLTAAEGWERLSLAERVERNRRLLQEVLGLSVPGAYFGQMEPGKKGGGGSLVLSPGLPRCWSQPRAARPPPGAASLRQPMGELGCFLTGMLRVLLVPRSVLGRNSLLRARSHLLGQPRSVGIIFPS